MKMKPFGGACEHARGGPLRRPKTDLRQNPFITTGKLTKDAAVTLGMDFSRKNLQPRNPRFLDLAFCLVCRDKLTRINARC